MLQLKGTTILPTNQYSGINTFINPNSPSAGEFGISDTGQIIIKNPATSLGLTLNNLMIGLTVFNSALIAAGATGVLAPVAGAATALQLVVSKVQSDITTLLE